MLSGIGKSFKTPVTKTSTESSSKNPWSDRVVILKLLLDCLTTVFGVNLTDVL